MQAIHSSGFSSLKLTKHQTELYHNVYMLFPPEIHSQTRNTNIAKSYMFRTLCYESTSTYSCSSRSVSLQKTLVTLRITTNVSRAVVLLSLSTYG